MKKRNTQDFKNLKSDTVKKKKRMNIVFIRILKGSLNYILIINRMLKDTVKSRV